MAKPVTSVRLFALRAVSTRKWSGRCARPAASGTPSQKRRRCRRGPARPRWEGVPQGAAGSALTDPAHRGGAATTAPQTLRHAEFDRVLRGGPVPASAHGWWAAIRAAGNPPFCCKRRAQFRPRGRPKVTNVSGQEANGAQVPHARRHTPSGWPTSGRDAPTHGPKPNLRDIPGRPLEARNPPTLPIIDPGVQTMVAGIRGSRPAPRLGTSFRALAVRRQRAMERSDEEPSPTGEPRATPGRSPPCDAGGLCHQKEGQA